MERKSKIAIDLEGELWISGLDREGLAVNARAILILMILSHFDCSFYNSVFVCSLNSLNYYVYIIFINLNLIASSD